LRKANLRDTDLRNADLAYSNLSGADLQDTNLDRTKFYPCQIPKDAGKLWGANVTPTIDIDLPSPARFRLW
jgi:uncharacterized protein YjbI with pentapeptide repeats